MYAYAHSSGWLNKWMNEWMNERIISKGMNLWRRHTLDLWLSVYAHTPIYSHVSKKY